MSDALICGAISAVACLWAWAGIDRMWRRYAEVTVTVTHTPAYSPPPTEDEDPVDFSSKPKSSATNLGS